MIITFDLDYTLIDANSFKNDLAIEMGQKPTEFALFYKKNFKDKGVNFNLDKIINLVAEKDGLSPKNIKNLKTKTSNLLKNIDKYIFEGCTEILKNFQEKDNYLVLLTFGSASWQKEKIYHLGIRKYFDEIIYEENKKSENKILKKLMEKGDDICLINDNAKESLELKKVLGYKTKVVLIKSKYSQNAKHNFKVLNTLNELNTFKI